MAGFLCLAGSGEFLAGMDPVDLAMLAGRPRSASVAIVPTASAPDGATRFREWADLGLAHFQRLGAQPWVAEIVDRIGSHDPVVSERLAASQLIYLSGGDPGFLVSVLRDSPAWAAMLSAHRSGAALSGCSAGAMALAGQTIDLRQAMGGLVEWVPALGLLPRLAVIPHFDRLDHYRPGSTERMSSAPPAGATLVGIDENTVALRLTDGWTVRGSGSVTILEAGNRRTIPSGGHLEASIFPAG